MRSIFKTITAIAIAGTMAATAFAVDIDQDSDPQSADAVITTEIAPAYNVTIPADTNVSFNATETAFGKVELTKAQLNPGKVISVTVESDEELNNIEDESKVIPYRLMAQYVPAEGSTGLSVPFYAKEQALSFSEAGQSFAMTIIIGEDDWNKAYAGSYSDTVTFTIDYVDEVDEDP